MLMMDGWFLASAGGNERVYNRASAADDHKELRHESTPLHCAAAEQPHLIKYSQRLAHSEDIELL